MYNLFSQIILTENMQFYADKCFSLHTVSTVSNSNTVVVNLLKVILSFWQFAFIIY